MRLTHALLVIVDISGYTRFITQRSVSLLHAEQIITELMESVIDRAALPLQVNKLEGDAALLYRECADGDGDSARDALAQVRGFFEAFARCLGRQRSQRAGCGCEACGGIDKLALKAFVHAGEIAIKQVRQFEELAGEEVILVHRLLKNEVRSREYVLLTEPVRAAAGWGPDGLRPHREQIEGLGERRLWLAAAADIPFEPVPDPGSRPIGDAVAAGIERTASFRHLPGAAGFWPALRRWWRRR